MTEFYDNYYGHLKDNYWFVIISKNACSTLKEISLTINVDSSDTNMKTYNNIKNEHKKIESTHYLYDDYNYVKKQLISDDKPKDSIVFAVWRDPVERFLSIYKNSCIDKKLNTSREYLNQCKSLSDLIDLGKYILEYPVINQDEHFRKQCDYYKLEDVDIVVDINDLHEYLKSIGIDNYEKINVSSSTINIDEDIKNRIKEVYKDDYIFYEQIKNSGKLWSAEKL